MRTFATLIALVSASLAVFVGTAGAAVITSPEGNTPAIVAESVSQVVLDNPIASISCRSALTAKVESHGEGVTAKGKISSLAFTSCVNGWHVTVVSAGELEVHWAGGQKGTVTSSGATIEATREGVTCRYATSNTDIGVIKGTPARLYLEGIIPFHGGSGLCGSGPTAWTGAYKVISPSYVIVDQSKSNGSITSPTGTVATPTIKAEGEGHLTLDHPLTDIECQWSLEGAVESHGEGEPVAVPLSSLSTTGCTDSWHATTVAAGELTIDWSSGYDGEVIWDGGTIEMTRFGTTCRYAAANTTLGTITGGSPATIDAEAAIPFHSGSPLCGESPTPLTGAIEVSSPESVFVDEGQVKSTPGTSITSPTGTVATPTIKAESEGHVVLHNPIAKIECASSAEGKVESHGEGAPASGAVSTLAFTGCTNSWHVTVVSAGELAVDWASGYNGTVTSNVATVETTRFGITCRYRTTNTDIGTLTGGTPATLHSEAAIPFHSGSGLCGTGSTTWTGNYKVSSPASLFVDEAPVEVEPGPGTSITSPTGTVATPTIKAESEGHVVLHNPIAKIECASSAEGKVESHGEGAPASGKLSTLAFTGCTNSWHVTVVSAGELAVDWASGYNGTVTSNGATVETTRFGITCRYRTTNTDIGTLTGGTPATLDITAAIPFHSGSGLCGTGTTTWTGNYKVSSPASLFVDEA